MGIFSKVLNLFKSFEAPKKVIEEKEITNILSGKVTCEIIGISNTKKVPQNYRPPTIIKWVNDANDSVEKLLKEVHTKGHKLFPLLNKQYSERWMIPNFELINFIKERLIKNDSLSITRVLDGLSCYENGLIEVILAKTHIPPNISNEEFFWLHEPVYNIIKKRYHEYLSFDNEIPYLELKALWIAITYSTRDYDRLLNEKIIYLDFISAVLACYKVEIKDKIYKGIKPANKILKDLMRSNKDLEISLYSENIVLNKDLPSTAFIERYNKLSVGARIHLYLSQIWDNNDDLKSCWRYFSLKMGVLPEYTINELLTSGFFDYEYKIVDIKLENYFEKKDLLEVATNNNIQIKNGWSRLRLMEAINNYDKNIIENLLNGKPKTKEQIYYNIKPEFKEDVDKLMKVIKNNRVVYDLLSCI